MNVGEIFWEIYNKYGEDVYNKVLSIAMHQDNYRFESNGRPLDYTIKLTENGEEEVRNCYEAINYFEKKDYEYLLDNLTKYRSSLDVSVKFKIDYTALIPNSNFDTIEKVEKYINNNIREIVHDVVVRGGLVEAYELQNQEEINGSEQFIKSELSKKGIILEELTIRNIKEITDKFPAKQKEDLIDENKINQGNEMKMHLIQAIISEMKNAGEIDLKNDSINDRIYKITNIRNELINKSVIDLRIILAKYPDGYGHIEYYDQIIDGSKDDEYKDVNVPFNTELLPDIFSEYSEKIKYVDKELENIESNNHHLLYMKDKDIITNIHFNDEVAKHNVNLANLETKIDELATELGAAILSYNLVANMGWDLNSLIYDEINEYINEARKKIKNCEIEMKDKIVYSQQFEPLANDELFSENTKASDNIQEQKEENHIVNKEVSNQRYEILKRERAVTDAQRSRVGAAVCAGICIIGTVAAIIAQEKLGVTNIQQVVQHELGSIYSFESLANYFKDIGPLTTLLAVGSMGAIAKYFNKNKKLILAHNDLIDYNQALIDANNIELGSDENARTR